MENTLLLPLVGISLYAALVTATLAFKVREHDKLEAENFNLETLCTQLQDDLTVVRNEKWLLVVDRDKLRAEIMDLESATKDSDEQLGAALDLLKEVNEENNVLNHRVQWTENQLAERDNLSFLYANGLLPVAEVAPCPQTN